MKYLDTVYLLKLQDHLEYMEFLIKTLPKILLEEKNNEVYLWSRDV